MTMGDRIHTLRKRKGLTLEYIGKQIGVAKSTVRKWESGDIISIRSSNLQKLADMLGVTLEYLLKGSAADDVLVYKNVELLPETKLVPIGEENEEKIPLLGKNNRAYYAEVTAQINADFALHCVGDSMINTHIFDGDLVFIQRQSSIENGEIAAVVINKEATLKRVYKYPNRLELRPENPLFPVLQYENSDLERVRIIGKAISFLGQVR